MEIKQPEAHMKHSDLRYEQPVHTWECHLFGTGTQIVLYTRKDNTPNAFHRFMQWLCFGNVWKRISNK